MRSCAHAIFVRPHGDEANAPLLESAGRDEDAAHWRAFVQDFARRWVRMARGPEAAVLDRVLGLGLFPQGVTDREMARYRTRLNTYGLPLDRRRAYTLTGQRGRRA